MALGEGVWGPQAGFLEPFSLLLGGGAWFSKPCFFTVRPLHTLPSSAWDVLLCMFALGAHGLDAPSVQCMEPYTQHTKKARAPCTPELCSSHAQVTLEGTPHLEGTQVLAARLEEAGGGWRSRVESLSLWEEGLCCHCFSARRLCSSLQPAGPWLGP